MHHRTRMHAYAFTRVYTDVPWGPDMPSEFCAHRDDEIGNRGPYDQDATFHGLYLALNRVVTVS